MRRIKSTTEERESVYKEVSERLKNVIYAMSYNKTKEMLDKIGIDHLLNERCDATLGLSFEINLLAGDIQEIVGGLRRKKEGG